MISRFFRSEKEYNDSGFGNQAKDRSSRLINKDGSFNVERTGIPFLKRFSAYHWLITMPWWKFQLIILGLFILVNLLFTALYLIIGMEELSGHQGTTFAHQLQEAFFFSVQTFTTVGYGRVSPVGFWGGLIASMEALSGILSAALATGLLYGRFSRPSARLGFSQKALIAPYKNFTSFQFRIANLRPSELIEVEARIMLSLNVEMEDGKKVLKIYRLPLEREMINFFPSSWTIVHPIDRDSPLYDYTHEDLQAMEAEFLISIKGHDESFSQNVYTRYSYRPDEIVWNARYGPMTSEGKNGKTKVDLSQLSTYYKVEAQSGLQKSVS